MDSETVSDESNSKQQQQQQQQQQRDETTVDKLSENDSKQSENSNFEKPIKLHKQKTYNKQQTQISQ
jgi:hypothetical protein